MLRTCSICLVSVIAACKPGNPQDACTDVAQAFCQRVFDLSNQGCASAAQYLADHSYVSLNDCTTGYRLQNASCAAFSCPATKGYSDNNASTCASQANAMTCLASFEEQPQSDQCTNICCTKSGDPGEGVECCSGASHIESSGCGFGGTSVCN